MFQQLFKLFFCLKGTFVEHQIERQNRIREMRANGLLNHSISSNASNSTITISAPVTSVTNDKNLPSWIIDEKNVNKKEYTCVICLDTYVEDDRVHGLPKCSHYFHAKCIQAWLFTSSNCPVCRSEV